MGVYETIVAAIKAAADIGGDVLQQVLLGTTGSKVVYPEVGQGTQDTGRLWSSQALPLVIEKIADEIRSCTHFDWNYLDTTLPTGVDPASLIAVYQFDATADALHDRSGNGYHLYVYSGSTSYCVIPTSSVDAGMYAKAFPEQTGLRLATAGHNAAFKNAAVNPFTVEVLMVYEGNTGQDDDIVVIGPTAAGSGLEVNNWLFRLCCEHGSGRFFHGHEYGAGIWTGMTDGYAYPGLIQHIIISRDAAGFTRMAQNGFVFRTGTLHVPTGGGNDILSIGRPPEGGTTHLDGAIMGLRFVAESYSDAQILESYQRVRGMID